jgi:Rrf2 family protein
MKISMRARYGLRLMIELGAHDGKGPLFLKNIARSQDISEKYLSQIVIDLKAANLIIATRGAHGGYSLARPPAEITTLDIVTALEGDLTLVECTRDPKRCIRATQCVSQGVWEKLGQAMMDSLRQIDLAELVEQLREKTKETAMYYI